MSGTFPTDAPWAQLTWSITSPSVASKSHSGKRLVRTYGYSRFAFKGVLGPMESAEWRDIMGFLAAQQGRYGEFTFTPPDFCNARGAISGAPTVNGASQTGRSIAIKELPASTGSVLLRGDFLKFANHDKVYLVTADVASDASGLATVSIDPALVTSPADDSSVTYDSVSFNVALTTDLSGVDLESPLTGFIELEFEEDA